MDKHKMSAAVSVIGLRLLFCCKHRPAKSIYLFNYIFLYNTYRQLRIKWSYVHVLSFFFRFLHIIIELDELYRMVLVLEFNFK